MNPGSPGGFPNYFLSVVGNTIQGNSFGLEPQYFGAATFPCTVHFSGNSLNLNLPYGNPSPIGPGAGVEANNYQQLYFCGNSFASAGNRVCFASASSNTVILANNFIGVAHSSIYDIGEGSVNVLNALVINNVLSYGDSYHLKVPFSEGPTWFLYNNQYVNPDLGIVPAFMDAANLWAHESP